MDGLCYPLRLTQLPCSFLGTPAPEVAVGFAAELDGLPCGHSETRVAWLTGNTSVIWVDKS